MINSPTEYSYNPGVGKGLLCGAVAGFACIVLANMAIHNDAGMILNGIIRFDQNGATIFYWVLAFVSGVGALLGLQMAIQSKTNPQVLRLGEDALTLPHGYMLSKSVRVPYSSITGMGEQQVSGQVFLNLATTSGQHRITASYLPSKHDYQAVKDFLVSQVQRQNQ